MQILFINNMMDVVLSISISRGYSHRWIVLFHFQICKQTVNITTLFIKDARKIIFTKTLESW